MIVCLNIVDLFNAENYLFIVIFSLVPILYPINRLFIVVIFILLMIYNALCLYVGFLILTGYGPSKLMSNNDSNIMR